MKRYFLTTSILFCVFTIIFVSFGLTYANHIQNSTVAEAFLEMWLYFMVTAPVLGYLFSYRLRFS